MRSTLRQSRPIRPAIGREIGTFIRMMNSECFILGGIFAWACNSTAVPPMTVKHLSVPYVYRMISLCCAWIRVVLTHTGRGEYYLVEIVDFPVTECWRDSAVRLRRSVRVGVNDNIGSFNASKLVAGGTWAPTR